MREIPYIAVILLVIVAAALFLGNSDPISAATGRAEADAALSAIPASGLIASKVLDTLFGIVLSGIVLGVAGVVIAQVRKSLRNRQYRQWRPGPNAHWQQSHQPKTKPMNTNQMMQWMLLSRLAPPTSPAQSTPPIPYVVSEPADESIDLRW
jgi:hypothetical protein